MNHLYSLIYFELMNFCFRLRSFLCYVIFDWFFPLSILHLAHIHNCHLLSKVCLWYILYLTFSSSGMWWHSVGMAAKPLTKEGASWVLCNCYGEAESKDLLPWESVCLSGGQGQWISPYRRYNFLCKVVKTTGINSFLPNTKVWQQE